MLIWTVQFRTTCRLVLIGLLLTLSIPAQVSGVKRIYVETFTLKDGAEKLRDDLIGQLRKAPSVEIVPARADADAVLSGNGEVWIRGYRSLNPRSGRSPSNGTPVYAGFVSVELDDLKGETLWSYLATVRAGSANISKDLSKEVAKHLAEAMAQVHGSSTSTHQEATQDR